MQVMVSTVGYAMPLTNVNPNLTITFTATTSSVSGSFAGGFPVAITGQGFDDRMTNNINSVSVCGFPCQITSNSQTSIICNAPALVTATSNTKYGLVQPNIVMSNWTTDLGVGWQNVSDHDFSTDYSSSSPTCFIQADFGLNLAIQLQRLKFFPAVKAFAYNFVGSVFEGSNDAITYTTILTLDATTHDGWNFWIPADPTSYPTYRYIRYREGSSNSNCNIAEIQFFGALIYPIDETTSCDVTVNIGGQIQTISNTVTYDDNVQQAQHYLEVKEQILYIVHYILM